MVCLHSLHLPVTLASAFLLHFLGVSVDVTRFGKVARKVVLGNGGSVGEGDMVTIVLFVGPSH